MNDIVDRLRATADLGIPDYTNSKLLREASEEITRLRVELAAEKEQGWKAHAANLSLEEDNDALSAENARLRGALKPFAARIDNLDKSPLTEHACAAMVEIEHLRAARAAIREGKMTDIVSRLHGPDGVEAANEILRLRMNNARLRAALKPFSAALDDYIDPKEPPWTGEHVDVLETIKLDDLRAARKAIKEAQDDE